MEPVNGTFLLLVCGLTLACVVAAVVLWPRLAASSPRTVVWRSGMLLVTQVLLTVTVALLANRYFVFYATWNDMFGSDVAKVNVKQVQPSGGGRAGPSEPVRRTPTDLGPRRRGHERDPVEDGRVDHLEIHGPRSGLGAEAYVYLPPQYFQPAYAAKRLPVVVLLSGGPPAKAWLRQAHLPGAAGTAAGSRAAQPMIYVMVGSARGCADTPGQRGGLPETLLAQDLPSALASTYRVPLTRKGWGLAGVGDGGQCAARLAMLHSDRFAAAANAGGRFGPPERPGAKADPYGGSAAYRRDNDPLWRLEHLPPPPVAVLATGGRSGEDARQADRLAALAKPPMWVTRTLHPDVPRTLAEWRPHLPSVLGWLSAHLRGE